MKLCNTCDDLAFNKKGKAYCLKYNRYLFGFDIHDFRYNMYEIRNVKWCKK
jgi:hypothetical protein